MSPDVAVVGIAASVAIVGMYLFFCWKVYDRSGDVDALKEAVKAGKFLQVLSAPLRRAAKAEISPQELPEPPTPPTPAVLDDAPTPPS